MAERGKPPLPPKREFLAHYGMPRRSGRYPWGSGEDPYQHSGDFASRYQELKKQGMSEKDIAIAMGCRNTSDLRVKYSQAINDRRALVVAKAKALSEDGLSPTEIGRIMGKNESTIRGYLDAEAERRMTQARKTAEGLKQLVEEKGMLDVGDGVERELGISKEKLKQALEILQEEGYPVWGGGVPQATNPGQQTNLKVLCPIGTEHKEIYNYDQIESVKDYKVREGPDGEDVFEKGFVYPKSMDSSRLAIRYFEEGGVDKDGVVEIRRGVPDLDLKGSHYAQVRILVDNDHYIKGMAVYSDDLPEGKDILFNTNKHEGTPMMDVLKKIDTKDPNNPFGSAIKEKGGQYRYLDENGNEQLGLINKRADEGDWGDWSNKLPSQFLSKQSQQLINKQLNLSIKDRELEFAEINALTNPTVKRKLMADFAEDCDAAAVHLQAAALPRQSYQVILPLTSIKDNEVYAPNYIDGETVALIRYPHGGTFEIPILKVNNKNSEGKDIITPNAADAVGINKKVADRLSGADFDGDTVMVIPCRPIGDRSLARPGDKPSIVSTHPLKELENFDTKMAYGPAKKVIDANGKERYLDGAGREYKLMTEGGKQREMGVVSNLITDMTLKGASESELARAVKHSMVVIDAVKHHLDYQKSEADNGIAALKKAYQTHTDPLTGEYKESGASTLISMAKSRYVIEKRKGEFKIDPDTGEKIFKNSGETYIDKSGKEVKRTQNSTKMAEVKDARQLSSGTLQEEAYARYANYLKELANRARKTVVETPRLKYEPTAKEVYMTEYKRLTAALNESMKNAPRERKAQLYAASVRKAALKAEPGLTKAELKKISQLALQRGREKYGAQRKKIFISDREWEAIQAGAVTDNILSGILRYSDPDRIRQLSTPRANKGVSEAKRGKILAMKASGYTNDEIARAVNLSSSTVSKVANG